MIKRTEVNQQKTPIVLDGKQSYSNKGTMQTKKAESFDANTTPNLVWVKAKLEEWVKPSLVVSFLVFINGFDLVCRGFSKASEGEKTIFRGFDS